MGDLIRAFLTVFPAELPDKSMVATIVLVARFRRPLAVWVGATLAFAIHVGVAVAAGRAVSLLPEVVVGVAVTTLFTVGAVVLFRSARSAEAAAAAEVLHEAERIALAADRRSPAGVATGGLAADGRSEATSSEPGLVPTPRAAAASFGIIVLAEWGDLTQLATASLAARSDSPVLTGVGSFLALVSVAAIAASVGRTLVVRMPLHRINYLSAAVFSALAVWSLVEVVAG